MDLLREEKRLSRKGYKHIAGLDEAGRGPLAASVVASAVIVNLKNPKDEKFKIILKNIKDSKQLSIKKREWLYKDLINHSKIEWGIGIVSEKVIDKINILEASKLAMKKALKNLEKKTKRNIDFLILDGNFKINLDINQESIVKADEKIFSCMVAGIIAKVYRDKLMKRYDKKYPEYGFNRHKGYATKFHKKMLKKYGYCEIHRKSFKPVMSMRKKFKNY